MKRLALTIAVISLLALPGCAQKPAPEAGFKDQAAMSYVQAHGLKVDVQLPAEFVGASTVIDSKAAVSAANSSYTLVSSPARAPGWRGFW